MPLESLGQKDGKLNIKGIETPDSKKEEFEFDVRKVITPEVWEQLYSILMNRREGILGRGLYRDDKPLQSYVEDASFLVQMLPEHQDKFAIIEGEILRQIKHELKHGAPASWEGCVDIELAAKTLILLPYYTLEDLGVTKEQQEIVKQKLDSSMWEEDGSAILYCGKLIAALQVFPGLRSELTITDLNQSTYEELKNDLLENENWSLSTDDSYREAIANLRLLFPEMPLSDLGALNESLVAKFGEERALEPLKKYFLRALFNRQVCAAQSIKITPHGVQFTMPEQAKFTRAVPDIPEIKKI